MMSPEDIAGMWRYRVDAVRDLVLARLKEQLARPDVGAVISSEEGQAAVTAGGPDGNAAAPLGSKAERASLAAIATKRNARELVNLKNGILDHNGGSDDGLSRRAGEKVLGRDQEAARMLSMVRGDVEPDLKRLAIEALRSGQK
jgi:hypothetical protein